MTPATTGAALKARRERLGWDMMQAAKAAMQQHQPNGTWLNGDIADVENGSWKYGHVLPAAYDAALTAEEQRRVREAERQRLRDAVREAEEAYGRAWAAHATACEGLKAARDRADETLEVADGYKLAVDKAREAARKGGAL